jgi:hypothetical protein
MHKLRVGWWVRGSSAGPSTPFTRDDRVLFKCAAFSAMHVVCETALALTVAGCNTISAFTGQSNENWRLLRLTA